MLDRTTAPEIRLIGDLALPEIEVERLNNGILLHTLSAGTQDANQLMIIWRGGTIESGNVSVGNLAALCMMDGTSTRSSAELSEALDYRGAIVRTMCQEHFTMLTSTCLNSMSRDLWPILADVIMHPSYDEHLVETQKMRACMAVEQKMKKVAWLADQQGKKMIMGESHPDAQEPTVESIMQATREEMIDFQRRITQSKGCMAFLSGKLDAELISSVRSFLSSLPQVNAPQSLISLPFESCQPCTVYIEKGDALQSAVVANMPALMRCNPDYIALRYTVTALGGYFGSRLMTNIREEKGLTYGIYSYLLGGLDGSYMSISAQTDNASVASLLHEIENEMNRLAREPMCADELLRLKQYLASKLVDVLETPFSIMNHYQMKYLVGTPDDYFEKSLQTLHALDADMIMEMASKYLRPEYLRIAVAGKV